MDSATARRARHATRSGVSGRHRLLESEELSSFASLQQAISDEVLDRLLDGRDPGAVFASGGLIDELKKRLAERLEEFATSLLGKKFPAIAQSWRRNWEQVIPFFAFAPEDVRKIQHDERERGNRLRRRLLGPLLVGVRRTKAALAAVSHTVND